MSIKPMASITPEAPITPAASITPGAGDEAEFPWTIPGVAGFGSMAFHPRVTFLVGDNGSGKSTIMEALAGWLGINPQGGNGGMRFSSLVTESVLSRYVSVVRGRRRPKDLFFFRPETMFSLFEAAAQDEAEARAAGDVDSWGARWRQFAERSHGESHFDVMCERMSSGLYLWDEPESALAVDRQMSLLTRIHDLVANGAQLVIATHSPVVLAYPEAWIYQLTAQGPQRITYTDSKPYRLMRLFMEHTERVVGQLLADDNDDDRDSAGITTPPP